MQLGAENMINLLRKHFEISECQSSQCCDYIASGKDGNVLFYIECKEHTDSIALSDLANRFGTAVMNGRLKELPMVVLTVISGKVKFGLLVWWEFNRSFVNRSIIWREISDETIELLTCHVRAVHNYIRMLPLNFLRVQKTIKLNHRDFYGDEIIYFRQFTDGYRMKTSSHLTEEERRNRLVTGTPEEEYPSDVLDELIFSAVVNKFPEAKKQTSLLLFDTDLLKMRNRSGEKTESLAIHVQTNTSFWQKTGMLEQFEIPLDLKYQANIFKRQNYPASDLLFEVEQFEVFIQCRELKKTYNRLSELNI